MRSELATGASPRARLLAVAGFAALLAGLAVGRPALLAFAAVTLAPLLLAPRSAGPTGVTVTCRAPGGELIEGDPVDIEIEVRLNQPAERLTARVEGDQTVTIDSTTSTSRVTDTDVLVWRVTLTPTRWGRAGPPTLILSATSRAGLRVATFRRPVPVELVALPRPVPVGPLTSALAGRARAGNHVAAWAGEGVEFVGVRPFVAGDSLRRVHWPVSSRRGQLYVTERAPEAAVDVVLVIDTLVESGPRGASTLDASLRGAAGVSRALLRNADRVGLVLLGGVLGWLSPASSTRAWYRLATAALRVAPYESYVTPDLDRIPRIALPPGALVVVFTPLLDDRVLSVCADLRRRRFTTIVVDVLGPAASSAPGRPLDAAGQRLWRLQQAASVAQLTALGCLATHWDGTGPLDVPLAAALRGTRRRAPARATS